MMMMKRSYDGKNLLVPKNTIFLKLLNFVQSFVECKVSLAYGTVALSYATVHNQGSHSEIVSCLEVSWK